MSNNVAFHEQLASLMEVLANTAFAEICKLVDDGYAVLRLEISQNQREIDNLRRKLLVTKLQNYRRNAEKFGTPRQRRTVQKHGDAGDVSRVQEKSRDSPAYLDNQNNRSGVLGTSTQEVSTGRKSSNPNAVPNTNNNSQGREKKKEGLPLIIKVESLTPSKSATGPPEREEVDPSNPEPCTPVRASQDWEPDVVVMVDPAPIKEEAGINCDWSLLDQEAVIREDQGTEDDDGERGGDINYLMEDFNQMPSTSAPSSIASSFFSSSISSSLFSTSSHLVPRSFHQQQKQGDQQHHLPNPQREPPTTQRGSSTHLPPPLIHYSSLLSRATGSADNQGGEHDRTEKPQQGAGYWYHLKCEVCGKLFPRPAALQRHHRVHTGEKPFSCRHCAKRFSYGHQLKNHERVHTGEKPFSCTLCGKNFSQSSHLKRHLSVHTGHALI